MRERNKPHIPKRIIFKKGQKVRLHLHGADGACETCKYKTVDIVCNGSNDGVHYLGSHMIDIVLTVKGKS